LTDERKPGNDWAAILFRRENQHQPFCATAGYEIYKADVGFAQQHNHPELSSATRPGHSRTRDRRFFET